MFLFRYIQITSNSSILRFDQECSGSVRLGIEGLLVQDSPESLLILVQPMKTGNQSDMTEKLLTGR